MVRIKKSKGAHYVDNKKFLEAMIEFKEKCKVAKENEEDQPSVSNYIGECFLKIATHLSYRPNFINYTYRDEMISDGIENCLQYVANFNPEKSIPMTMSMRKMLQSRIQPSIFKASRMAKMARYHTKAGQQKGQNQILKAGLFLALQ